MRSDRLVRVCVGGGLGNQLFQYAYAIAVAELNDAPIEVDTRFCPLPGAQEPYRHGLCGVGFFPISARILPTRGRHLWQRLATKVEDSRFQTVVDVGAQYLPELMPALGRRWLIKGLMQSYRYFDSVRERVSQELDPCALLAGLPADLVALASAPSTCAVHVRRGDYLTHSVMNLPRMPDYYQSAIMRTESEQPNTHFLIFSDDPRWCQEAFANLSVRSEVVATSHPNLNALQDFALMAQAPRMIMANSTFSWWAAWLGPAGKTVTAPARWSNNDNRYFDDLIPPHWQRISF